MKVTKIRKFSRIAMSLCLLILAMTVSVFAEYGTEYHEYSYETYPETEPQEDPPPESEPATEPENDSVGQPEPEVGTDDYVGDEPEPEVGTDDYAGDEPESEYPEYEDEPNPEPPSAYEPASSGRLLIIKRAQTGQLLQDAMFEVRRHIDDLFVATVVTDIFGEATLELPAGEYFLREIAAPEGFSLNPVRIPFRITQGMVTPITVANSPLPVATPTPLPTPAPERNNENGRIIITARARGTNELLPGAVFELRRAMDNAFVAELATNQFGEAAINLPPGDYFFA